MNASRYSTGTSWFTSNGRSLRKIFPTTRTRLNIAIANSTFTSSSRLTNLSISFIFQQQTERSLATDAHRLAQISEPRIPVPDLCFVCVDLWLEKSPLSHNVI